MIIREDEPKYILNGIDKVTFWGEHSVILAWYVNLVDDGLPIIDRWWISDKLRKAVEFFFGKLFL